MHPKSIVFLIALLVFGQVHARILRSGLGDDVQSITITEFAPHGRTVSLTKPEEVSAFVHRFDGWSISAPQTFKRDFYNVFPVRYSITVQRKASTQTLYLAVQNFSQWWVDDKPMGAGFQFFLCQPEKDGSVTEYLDGDQRTLNAGNTPLEHYLAQLFPPA